jgi:hypothetical protein
MSHEERETESFFEYIIYVVDEKGNRIRDVHVLKELKTSIETTILIPRTKDYIWTKQGISLDVVSLKGEESKKDENRVLYGLSYYADNVEDEWFMISLLFEISKTYLNTVMR